VDRIEVTEIENDEEVSGMSLKQGR
jgi:hypothetical protein